MRKKTNIIQIRGIRGLIFAFAVVCCLIAGFVVFPGWIWMNIWNLFAQMSENVPQIGLIQGVILWTIIYLSYKLLRKEGMIICIKTPQTLSEDELKEVFADIKKQSQEDVILQAMMKARETELQLKKFETENKENEQPNSKV